MKFSGILIVVLFNIISEISCIEDCNLHYENCLKDSDCCSNKCQKHRDIGDRYCLEPDNVTNELFNFTDPIEGKVQDGLCSYYKPKSNKEISESNLLYATYGINAANILLPANTKVEVTLKKNTKKLILYINNVHSTTNGSILDLSPEAAKELGIDKDGLIDCSVKIWTQKPPTYFRFVLTSLGVVVFIFTVFTTFA